MHDPYPYRFIISQNVGLSLLGNGLITIHLSRTSDAMMLFNNDDFTIPADIRYLHFPFNTRRLRIGQVVRLHNRGSHSYSLPIRIDGLFQTAQISQKFPPQGFAKWLENKSDFLSLLSDLSQPWELSGKSTIIQSLFTEAMLTNSYTLSYSKINQMTGHTLSIWLDELVTANFVRHNYYKRTLTITNALIYIMMHKLNQRSVSNPIFVF